MRHFPRVEIVVSAHAELERAEVQSWRGIVAKKVYPRGHARGKRKRADEVTQRRVEQSGKALRRCQSLTSVRYRTKSGVFWSTLSCSTRYAATPGAAPLRTESRLVHKRVTDSTRARQPDIGSAHSAATCLL
jgi:hypothetical protein